MDSVYVITTLHSKKTKRKRTWGWFNDFEEAKICAMQNHGDIYECGFYNLVVIEELFKGIILRANNQYWFSVEYEPDYGSYVVTAISKPLQFAKEHLIAF